MTLVLCVDGRGGLLFHGRRQSQDRLLREDLLREIAGHRLWVTPYTARQFSPEEMSALSISTDPLREVGNADYCLVEDLPMEPFLARADRLLLYGWNRIYPADHSLPLPPPAPWKHLWQEEFEGYSHKKITKDVYTR